MEDVYKRQEGTTVVKRLINTVLKFYEGNPMSRSVYSLLSADVIASVSERLTGICPGYFGVGEKLFNQGRIECERILQQPPQPVSYTHLDVYKRQA